MKNSSLKSELTKVLEKLNDLSDDTEVILSVSSENHLDGEGPTKYDDFEVESIIIKM